MDAKLRLSVSALVLFTILAVADAKYCVNYGHSCSETQECCGSMCCYIDQYDTSYRSLRWSVWNMWYFWFIVIFILMTCFGTCGYWRRRHVLLSQRQANSPFSTTQFSRSGASRGFHAGPMPQAAITVMPGYEVSYLDGRHVLATRQTVVPPTQGSFPSPPPYAEVVSKPDVYRPHAEKEGLPPYPGQCQGVEICPAMVIGPPSGLPIIAANAQQAPPIVQPANQVAPVAAIPLPATGGTTVPAQQPHQDSSFLNSSYDDNDRATHRENSAM